MTREKQVTNSSPEADPETQIACIHQELSVSLQKLWRSIRSAAPYCLIVAFLMLLTANFVPRYFADITVTATGRKTPGTEKGTAVWLTSPRIHDLQNGDFEIRKSEGWELHNGMWISTRHQPAVLRLTGYFPLYKNIEFFRTPHSGEVIIRFNGHRLIRDLSQGSGKEVVPLLDYLPKKASFLIFGFMNVMTGLTRNFLLLLLVVIVARKLYPELETTPIARKELFGIPDFLSSFRKTRTILIAASWIVMVNLPFLNSPRPPERIIESWDLYLLDMLGFGHIIVNPDSWMLMNSARVPSLLFWENIHYIDRPVYTAIGFLLSLPLRGFRTFFEGTVGGRLGPLLPEFIAYILFNLAVLTAAALLLQELTGSRLRNNRALLLPFLIMIANPVTKIFLWTPHFQVLNLCIPVFSVALNYWLLNNVQSVRTAYFAVLGILLGFCFLLYGAFGITAAGIVLILIFSRRWTQAILLSVMCCLPTLLWVSFVVSKTGSYNPGAISSVREFVWVLDALHDGGFINLQLRLREHLSMFKLTLEATIIFPAAVFVCCLLMRFLFRLKICDEDRHQLKNLRHACFWHFIVALPFFALMGFYATRRTWALVPILLILMAAELKVLHQNLQENRRVVLEAIVVIVSVTYFVYWVLQAGPYA